MEKLTKFEEKILVVLKNLQYLCDVVESYNPDTKKGIEYSFSDMFPPIKGQEELEYVIQYLKKNGLDVSITFDISNEDPNEPIYIKKYGEIGNVPLGLIKGKNIEVIKITIKELLRQLVPVEITKGKKESLEIYSNNKEEIILKTLGVKIQGNRIFIKKSVNDKKVFDPSEEALIYFLYYRFKKNKEECFSLETLAKELKTSKGHLKNRITNIHKVIGENISENTRMREKLIKNVFGHGYRLNPRLFV